MAHARHGEREKPVTPRVVLVCHDDDAIDVEGLSAWLQASMELAGLVIIQSPWSRVVRAARREIRRSGWLGFLDVLAFRTYYRAVLAGRDAAWQRRETERLKGRYAADVRHVPHLFVTDPNGPAAQQFLERLQPDLVIARCKVLLRPAIFRIARAGTFALHPGICPEYRNSHGCFWALARRDLGRVGMTLLRIDEGVDTGPIFFRGGCRFDEEHESHVVIQYRAVTENLDAIAARLRDICAGRAEPLPSEARASKVWGQPRLTAYWNWKAAIRREQRRACGVPS